MTSDEERGRLLERALSLNTSIMAALAASCSEQWARLDLTMPQLKVLFVVHAHGGAMRSGALAERLGVHLSTVTGVVDRLSESGLVRRGEDPQDRRLVLVENTPAGDAVIRDIYASGRATLRTRLEVLAADELAIVVCGLEGLEQALGGCGPTRDLPQHRPPHGQQAGPRGGPSYEEANA